MFSKHHKDLFESIQAQADKDSVAVYLIGGTIRDILVGNAPYDSDLDFVVEGDAISFAREFAKSQKYEVKEFQDFNTAKVAGITGFGTVNEVDFASARTEIYEVPGALPNVKKASLLEDLSRRDFSINSMAVRVQDMVSWLGSKDPSSDLLMPLIIDRNNGANDLKQRTIRILHERSFVDDPTRIFRACRYCGRLNGTIDPKTAQLLSECIQNGGLATISSTRILNEIKKIFEEREFNLVFKILMDLNVIDEIGLFNLDSKIKIEATVSKLSTLNFGESRNAIFESVLMLFYLSFAENEREERFRRFGFGRKSFKVMNLEALLPKSVEHGKTYSTAGLIYHFINASNDAMRVVSTELSSRGMKY